MDVSEINIQTLKELRSSNDVFNAVVDLSRKMNGAVIVRLDDVGTKSSIWVHPRRIQMEVDHPREYAGANNHLKFRNDVEQHGLVIGDIRSLDVDTKYPSHLGQLMAAKKFAEQNGFEDDAGAYPGRYKAK